MSSDASRRTERGLERRQREAVMEEQSAAEPLVDGVMIAV